MSVRRRSWRHPIVISLLFSEGSIHRRVRIRPRRRRSLSICRSIVRREFLIFHLLCVGDSAPLGPELKAFQFVTDDGCR